MFASSRVLMHVCEFASTYVCLRVRKSFKLYRMQAYLYCFYSLLS